MGKLRRYGPKRVTRTGYVNLRARALVTPAKLEGRTAVARWCHRRLCRRQGHHLNLTIAEAGGTKIAARKPAVGYRNQALRRVPSQGPEPADDHDHEDASPKELPSCEQGTHLRARPCVRAGAYHLARPCHRARTCHRPARHCRPARPPPTPRNTCVPTYRRTESSPAAVLYPGSFVLWAVSTGPPPCYN